MPNTPKEPRTHANLRQTAADRLRADDAPETYGRANCQNQGLTTGHTHKRARLNDGLQSLQRKISKRSAPLTGFNGEATFTLTLLFLGSQGQELAERLAGIAVPDFYGAYLEQRLATERKAL